jgi:MFS family permease
MRIRQFVSQLQSGVWRYLIGNSLFYLGFMVVVFLYNLYLEDMGFSQTTIGQITSLVGLGMMAGSMPGGLLADRFGARPVLLVATFGMFFAVAMRSMVTSLPLLFAGAFLDGISLAMFTVSGPVLLTSLTNSENRNLAFSLSGVVLFFNSIVGTLLGGALPALLQEQFSQGVIESERWTLLLSRLPLLGAAALYATLPNPITEQKTFQTPRRFRINLPLVLVLTITVIIMLMVFADSLFLPFANIYFRREFDLDTASISQLAALINVITVIIFFVLPRLSKRLGEAQAVSLFRFLTLPLMLGLLVQLPLPLTWLVIMVAQITQQISWVMIDGLILSGIPEHMRGQAMGVKATVFGLGVATAVPLGGWLADMAGYSPGIVLTAILGTIFGAVVIWWHTSTQDRVDVNTTDG